MIFTTADKKVVVANVELPKQPVFKEIINTLSTYKPVEISADGITLKNQDFTITLAVNHSLKNIADLAITLNDDNINLEYAGKYANQAVQIPDLQNMAILNMDKKDFIVSIFKIFNAIAEQPHQAKNLEEIMKLSLQELPDDIRPKFQQQNQEQDSLKYFIFPYVQNDEINEGEILYNSYKDKENNEITSLDVKVNFSELGDVNLSFKILNNKMKLTINLNNTFGLGFEEKLIEIATKAVASSVFLGTVKLENDKEEKNLLAKYNKVSYNYLNVEI